MCLCERLELQWTDMTKKLLGERPAIREAALTNRDSSEAAGHLHVQGTDGEGEFRVRDRYFGNVLASGANSGPWATTVVLLNSTRLDTSIKVGSVTAPSSRI